MGLDIPQDSSYTAQSITFLLGLILVIVSTLDVQLVTFLVCYVPVIVSVLLIEKGRSKDQYILKCRPCNINITKKKEK